MRVKDCRVRIQSPPSTTTIAPKSTNSSHCSKCSHCHPSKTPSVSSPTTGKTPSVIELNKPIDAASQMHRSFPKNQPLPMAAPQAHASYPLMLQPHTMPVQHNSAMAMPMPMPMSMPLPMPMMTSHKPRLHPFAPAPVLHNLGRGPEPLFGWESVMSLSHAYGQPKYIKRVKPDYRRFCFSVGKADVPFAAMPGRPLWGMDVTMAPQMVGSHRW